MKDVKHVNVLLLELLFVILIFMLASPVIVELYGNARLKSIQTKAANSAMLEAENLAEELYGRKDAETVLTARGFAMDAEGESWILEKEEYTMTARVSEEAQGAGVLRTVTLSAARGEKPLVEIPAVCYFPGEVSP